MLIYAYLLWFLHDKGGFRAVYGGLRRVFLLDWIELLCITTLNKWKGIVFGSFLIGNHAELIESSRSTLLNRWKTELRESRLKSETVRLDAQVACYELANESLMHLIANLIKYEWAKWLCRDHVRLWIRICIILTAKSMHVCVHYSHCAGNISFCACVERRSCSVRLLSSLHSVLLIRGL